MTFNLQKISWGKLYLAIPLLIIIMILAPFISLFIYGVGAESSSFKEMYASGIIGEYCSNTLSLMLLVTFFSLFWGVTISWLITYFEFKGSRILEFALLLPLIVPAWISAWSYKEIFDYSGPYLQIIKFLHLNHFITDEKFWFIRLDNIWGASFILTFAMYPYVYLFSRNAFLHQSGSMIEAARILNCSNFKYFFRIAIPLARPAIAAGALVIMMEVLNDYGTVKYFSIPVLALGIEDAWLNRSDIDTAAILSILTLAIAILLLVFEQLSRKKVNSLEQANNRRISKIKLHGFMKYICIIFISIPIIIGFVIPFVFILNNAINYLGHISNVKQLLYVSMTSIGISSLAAFFTVIFALIISVSCYYSKDKALIFLSKFTTIGYAIPGIILGTSVIIFTIYLDGIAQYLMFFGGIFMLIYAWSIRFLALGIGNIESGLNRTRSSLRDAARTLGCSKIKMFFKVELPLLKAFIFTSWIMIFIECLKELPIAMLLRPLGLELLALEVWQFGSMEQLDEASPGALILIFVGIIPITFLWKKLQG